MTDSGPLVLVRRIVSIFDRLGIPYALGGSMASSIFGEPRSTADIDMAVRLDPQLGEQLLGEVRPDFYVPLDAARESIRTQRSFNLVAPDGAMKIDVFVLGDGLLDRQQIERRVLIPIPGLPEGIWVTSAEDQVLRKLDWYRAGGEVSERQWRDVIGIVMARRTDLDVDYLRAIAGNVGLSDLLEDVLSEASPSE